MIPSSKNCIAIARSCFASVATTPRLSSGTFKKRSETRVGQCASRLRPSRSGLAMLAAEVQRRISKWRAHRVEPESIGHSLEATSAWLAEGEATGYIMVKPYSDLRDRTICHPPNAEGRGHPGFTCLPILEVCSPTRGCIEGRWNIGA